jgi:magnesium transporter
MLIAYTVADGRLNPVEIRQYSDLVEALVWIDLVNPDEVERQWIAEAYGQQLQFMEELSEIEASARFYRNEHGLHMNQYFLVHDATLMRNINVAFTLNKGRLFTLRGEQPHSFEVFVTQATGPQAHYPGAVDIMIGIVATRVGLIADLYERLQAELEPISQSIIRGDMRAMPRALQALTRIEDSNGKARLSLLENRRAYPALLRNAEGSAYANPINDIMSDVDSLTAHSGFLAERTKFLMDAAMGTLNIAFNKRLNIFTVLSVVLMPPTLIASIYGMNFEHMPELKWLWGYPAALLLMIAVAVGPILYLKRKNWL